MLTYLFSSLAIKAVGRTAQKIVQDVRDQFRENPGIMAGTSKPDYARCVHIVTGAALKEMVLPGVLAVGLPVAVGLIFRNFSSTYGASAEVLTRRGIANVPSINGVPVNLGGATAVAGLLMVGTIGGILLAMLMNNGGGAWDNAKKWIETGQYGGKQLRCPQGRGRRRHRRRPLQGHRRPLAPRAHQTPRHHHPRPRAAVPLTAMNAESH